MMKYLVLSGVALTVLMLAAAPASAQINLGGNVGVDVNLDAGNGNIVDINGDGDAAVDVNLGTGDNGVGHLVDLGGDVDTLIDLNGNGIIDADELDATIDLFGPGGKSRVAVGTDLVDGADGDDVILTLFGPSGDGDVANVNILPTGPGAGGIDPSDVIFDIFGPEPASPMPPADPTETGSIPDGSGGGGGDDDDGNTVGDGPGGRSTEIAGTRNNETSVARPGGNAVRVASTGKVKADCFIPDDTQIAHLVNRNSYDASVTASWQQTAKVSLVPINICPEAKAKVATALQAKADIGAMMAAVSANAKIKGALGGRGPGNVLAIDQSGDTLTVYVY
jgi:hypothetical protein